MADSIVCFVAAKMRHFLSEPNQLPRGVCDDAEFIRNELEGMSAFLRVAEEMENREPEVRNLLQQAIFLAYDMEYVLDDYEFQLHHKKKYLKYFKTKDKFGSKILDIISRMAYLSVKIQMYNLDVPLEDSSSVSLNKTRPRHVGDAVLGEVQYNLDVPLGLVGMEMPKRLLIGWLLSEESFFKVISVVGMGGIGKTALVKHVYNDFEVQKHFAILAWITLSQTFSVEKILRDLICQIVDGSGLAMPQGIETMGSWGLMKVIRMILHDSRSLVVIDNVWNLEAWDAIKYVFPLGKYGSRIMLSTRNHKVARATCSEFKGEVYFVETLSPEMSWELLRRNCQEGKYPSDRLSAVSKKCGGLPLAIVGNPDNIINRKTERISKVLLLSYYDLPVHLKACLLFFVMFPRSNEINCFDLIRLWIAEGFVEKEEGMTLEEVAYSYLNELIDRSLIQVASLNDDDSILTCCIHVLLQEALVSKPKDLGFVVDRNNRTWNRKARRVILHKNWPFFCHEPMGIPSFFWLDFSDKLPSEILSRSNFRQVKALNLGDSKLKVVPNTMAKLFNLRYFSSSCTELRVIPSSIGKLRNVETLKLRNTYVTKLPLEVLNLQHLRHLIVYHEQRTSNPLDLPKIRGFDAICGIGCLKSLQDLFYMELNRENYVASTIIDLGRLTQLRGLGILNLRRQDCPALLYSIEKLTNLRQLCIESADEEIIDLQHISSPSCYLRWLILSGCLEQLPHRISSLYNLAVLKLYGSRLRENVLESVQALPNLVHLELYKALDRNELCFEDGGFQKLKTLRLEELPSLIQVEVKKSAMPCLENLCIHRCLVLKNVPLGIENLAKLKKLELSELPEDLIDSIDPAKGGNEFSRLEHIDKVHIFYYKNGRRFEHTLRRQAYYGRQLEACCLE